ncbi:restriction endonuclease subunit S [Aeromonas allosaccharophila]|uniref:restriction endonuclease subunit S n=1 Tax=Aeromonas allosaccharophila TaxID=656 RepID=UPI003D202D78
MKLPDSWHKSPLGELFKKIVVGYVGNVNDHYCDASRGVPFYRTLNIRDGYFRHDEIRHVTKEFNDKNKKSQIENDDIVIARVGANLGMVCKVSGLNGMANMANAIIIKNKSAKNASSDFYTYFLLSPYGKSQIYAGAAGGAQGVFNTKLTQEISVPVPPLPEQKKIAKILSTWDKAITTTEQLLANSQQQKKALMQQLLTGKKRLLDIKTGVIFERDFKTLSLRDVCSMQAGKFINASDILNGHQDGTYPCFGGNGLRGYTKTFTHDGEFSLIGRQGALCGNITFATGCFHATEHAVVVTPRSNINTKWLYYALVDLNLNQYATGVAQPGLSVKNIEQVSIKVPESINEQQKIAAVLSAADQEITTLKQKLDALKQEKKALMQQLLTGKRRVQQLKDVES